MKKSHSLFSNIAFNLAEKNLGKTKDNPSVGCVVVKNNSVISSGCTSLNGRPHAEFIALNKNINFKGSYMYVTLEPCTHYGVTPPCTNLIKKKKINKVFYFFNDPDKRTNKKAAKILKNVVQTKQIPERYKYFYESYFLNKNKHYPLIDAKIAISKDYFTINKKNKWITNTRSRKVVHLIRSNYDCIISTSKSLNKDNSILNCRINGLNKFKPDLIIIDRYLKIKKNLKLFKLSRKRKIFLITLSNNKKKIDSLRQKKIKIIKIDKLDKKEDFINLNKILFNIGKRRVLVEAGLVFLNKLIKFKIINNLYIFKTNTNLRKDGYNNLKSNFIKKIKLINPIKVNLDEDKFYKVKMVR